MLKFKTITYKDVELLKSLTLRKADIDELRLSTGIENPLDGLKYAVKHSNEWAKICYYEETGEVICIFGLASMMEVGIPWMMGSPKMRNHKKLLMRYSKTIINEMLDQFKILNNYVDSRNELHIRWLKHMGFKFTGQDHMIKGIPFKYFYKRRDK